MKIAMCMSGVPRGEYEGFNFIKNMSEKYDCYLFLHNWNPNTFPNQESWSKKNPSPFSLEQVPLPRNKIFHKQEEFPEYEPKFKEIYDRIPAQFQWRKDLGVCSMFHSIKQACVLKEEFEKKESQKFDCVFRIRFETPVKFITIEKFDLQLIHIPSYDSYPICDQFAFSDSDNMSYYCDCYDNIVELAQKDLYHPERILNQHLKSKVISMLHFGNDRSL